MPGEPAKRREMIVKWKAKIQYGSGVMVLVAAVSSGWAQSLPSTSEREATAKAVTNWLAGGCGAWGGPIPLANNLAGAWMAEITNSALMPFGHGFRAWSFDTFHVNGAIGESDFTDAGVVPWGGDHSPGNIDEADASFVCSHGNHFPDTCYGLHVRMNEAGFADCFVHQQDMFLGNSDLEFLVLFTCHSMCQVNWWGACGWGDEFDRLHQLLGFHGSTYASLATVGGIRDFVDDAFNGPLAITWLDHMYYAPFGPNNDRCPVARAIGDSASDVTTRQSNEEYDSVYPDPPVHGAPGRSPRVLYMIPCNPNGEAGL